MVWIGIYFAAHDVVRELADAESVSENIYRMDVNNVYLPPELFLECDKECKHDLSSECCIKYCMHKIHLSNYCIECRNICGVVAAYPEVKRS